MGLMLLFLTLVLVFFILAQLLRAAYAAISSYCLVPTRIKNIMERQGVYGPKPRFLTGNLLEMATMVSMAAASGDMVEISHDIVGRLLPHYLLWSKQYGKRFVYWCNTEPRMCLMEPKLIKELLSAKYTHISGKSWVQQENSKHFIGKGLLMANGEEWYHQRHIVAPAFKPDKLKAHAGYMVEFTRKMLATLEKRVDPGGGGCGEADVEISEHLTNLTADIISRTEFGSSHQKGKKIFRLLTSLQHLCAQSSRHYWFPGSRYIPSKYNRDIKAMRMEVEGLLMEIIQTRKDGVEVGRSTSYGDDLLGLLLSETQKKRPGFSFNLQVLMDECKTFFFTGHETTALLLTWTIMLLATNPSWQDRARAQVVEACNGGGPLTADHLPKLTLLHMIINESLRLYPPAALLPRMTFEDMKLGDLQVPKGLSIWIPVLAIHHDEDLWGKDVNEFNPERFAGRPACRHFMPFSAGPRHCVGQSFAMMEAKIILAMFLLKFKFTISEKYRHAPVYVLTLKPKHGVHIKLKPI